MRHEDAPLGPGVATSRAAGTRLRGPGRALALLALALGCPRAETTLTLPGTVEIRDVQVAPLTSGRVVRLLKDEGDTVRRGDTIAVLEQPGLDELIVERRAQARAAGLRVHEVAAAEADSARAASDLARAQPLRAQNIVSQQQFDGLRAAAEGAAARLAAMRAAPSDSAAARAALAATLAQQAELTLVAPDDGLVLTRYIEPGEVVASGAPVVAIGLVRRPWIRAFVGDPFIGRVRVGQAVSVRPDGAARSFAGRVVEISPQAEFTPRAALTERERADLVFGIKIALDEGDAGGQVKAGMPVTVAIPLGR